MPVKCSEIMHVQIFTVEKERKKKESFPNTWAGQYLGPTLSHACMIFIVFIFFSVIFTGRKLPMCFCDRPPEPPFRPTRYRSKSVVRDRRPSHVMSQITLNDLCTSFSVRAYSSVHGEVRAPSKLLSFRPGSEADGIKDIDIVVPVLASTCRAIERTS